jgi:hypothetical protein
MLHESPLKFATGSLFLINVAYKLRVRERLDTRPYETSVWIKGSWCDCG